MGCFFYYIDSLILGVVFMCLKLVDRAEPKIVKLDSPIKMVGVSKRTGAKTIYKDAVLLGKAYQKIKAQNIIRNKKEPRAFVAVSKDFSNDNSSWDYLMGDVVTSFSNVPEGLTTFDIPSGTYAVFTIRPKFRFLWGSAIGLTKRYIFTKWLPNSKYDSDQDVVGDFEYHDQRSVSRNPSIELFVPVREKDQ